MVMSALVPPAQIVAGLAGWVEILGSGTMVTEAGLVKAPEQTPL